LAKQENLQVLWYDQLPAGMVRESLLNSNDPKDKEGVLPYLFQQPQPLWPSQNWLWPLCMMLTSPCLARANRRMLFLHAQALAPKNKSTRMSCRHQLLLSQVSQGGIAWLMRAASSEFRIRAILSKLHQTGLGFAIQQCLVNIQYSCIPAS